MTRYLGFGKCEPLPDCEACEGMGWENYSRDGTKYTRQCSCRIIAKRRDCDARMDEELAIAGMETRDIASANAPWVNTGTVGTHTLRSLKEWAESGSGICVFHGPPGSGKTKVAAKLLRYYLLTDPLEGAIFCPLVSFLPAVMQQRKETGFSALENALGGAGFIVLDDLGGAQRAYPETHLRALESWIMHAYSKVGVRMVLTTNEDIESGQCAGLSPAVQSRIAGGRLVRFGDRDYRIHGNPKGEGQ